MYSFEINRQDRFFYFLFYFLDNSKNTWWKYVFVNLQQTFITLG